MFRRRVVITGCGLLSAVGVGVDPLWKSIANAQSLVSSLSHREDLVNCKTKIGSVISLNESEKSYYESIVSAKDRRRLSEFISNGVVAAHDALRDGGFLDSLDKFDLTRFATIVGSGIGGINEIHDAHDSVLRGRLSPFYLPSVLINLLPGNIAIKFGLKGPSFSHVSACATSKHAIGESLNMIRYGMADVVVTGGSESAIGVTGITAFNAMGALSTEYNNDPTKASRPLDKNRDGFVMADCSAILILEELEHAKKRGAKIYGEVLGYGASCDAGHITTPDSSGESAARAMSIAIKDAGIDANNIDYVNLHGTSTPVGDLIELTAVKRVFGDYTAKLPLSSTKSMTGHALGAAGALESIICLKAMQDSLIPATINLENPEDECANFNIIKETKGADLKYVLSNSFGFGGTNATLVFGKYLD